MKLRPIIFSGSMVQAILEGRKTQTRRVTKLPENARDIRYWSTPSGRPQEGWADPGVNYWTDRGNHIGPCPYGFPGDRLWVRETWNISSIKDLAPGESLGRTADQCILDNQGFTPACSDGVVYRATRIERHPEFGVAMWRPSIHMPRWASRITLTVTGVRVERLQDISSEDAISEGIMCSVDPDKPCEKCGHCEGDDWDSPIRSQCNPRSAFADLWESINGGRQNCSWDANPWVWIVEFERVMP